MNFQYRKRPVVIEAIVLPTMPRDEAITVPTWFSDAYLDGAIVYSGSGTASIDTLEGTLIANPGDYIIRGIKGELYPCKPDIFVATYEKVTE